MVGCIGEALRFQGNSRPGAVCRTRRPRHRAIEVGTGVDLHPRLVTRDVERPPGQPTQACHVPQALAVDDEVVVEALAVLELLVAMGEGLADAAGSPEVEGGPVDGAQLSGGNTAKSIAV